MAKKVDPKLRILVTGASGFVGTHLVDLLRKDYQVIPFDKNSPKKGPKGIVGDLTDLKDITEACDRVDGVIHLAALSRVKTATEQPRDCMNINVMGTVNVLEAVRNSKKRPWLIMGSTCAVDTIVSFYDHGEGRVALDSLYGMSKFMGEYLCAHYARVFNVRTLVLRFSDIYGSTKDNADKMIPKITGRARAGEDIIVHGGDQCFDLIYYEDIIRGIKTAVEHIHRTGDSTNFEIIPLCTGRWTSLNDLVDIIVRKTRSSSKVKRVLAKDPKKRPGKARPYRIAERRLGFRARTDFLHGIQNYLQSKAGDHLDGKELKRRI